MEWKRYFKGEIRMIKLSIKGKPELKKEKEYKGILSLRQNHDGSVSLNMEDEKYPNHPWNILSIESNGTLYKCTALPHDIGLQVNNKGRIIGGEE